MECDAAGANIYHIIVRGNTFHSFFFLTFTFNFMFILEGWKLAIKIQVCDERKLTLFRVFFFTEIVMQKVNSSPKERLRNYLG